MDFLWNVLWFLKSFFDYFLLLFWLISNYFLFLHVTSLIISMYLVWALYLPSSVTVSISTNFFFNEWFFSTFSVYLIFFYFVIVFTIFFSLFQYILGILHHFFVFFNFTWEDLLFLFFYSGSHNTLRFSACSEYFALCRFLFIFHWFFIAFRGNICSFPISIYFHFFVFQILLWFFDSELVQYSHFDLVRCFFHSS